MDGSPEVAHEKQRNGKRHAAVNINNMENQMNIAGVVVHARPGAAEAVAQRMTGIAGVEVHARTADHRLIVTVEEAGGGLVADTLVELDRLDGVLSVAMVYQHCESLAEESQ